MQSFKKKIVSLVNNGIEPLDVGMHNFRNPVLEIERLAENRMNECSGCEFFQTEPISFLRVEDKRIDIFFYHRNGCRQSEKFCQSLYNTINHKYKKNQPGREYCGTISARDLFTLRNTTIPAAYIELGNIQNPKDQLRLIRHDNRQAIANWLYEGIINFK